MFLILALSAGAFAQEEAEQGLKFSGELKTGVQFKTDSAQEKAADGKKHDLYDPSIRMYNDDAGAETRLDLNGAFTKDNYGVIFRLRTDKVISGPQVEVNQAYVWADFLNEVLNIKVGRIDDSAWSSDGDEGFHYSTGYGLRFEVKPIDGLNVGFFLNGPNNDDILTAVDNGEEGSDHRVVVDSKFEDGDKDNPYWSYGDYILAGEFLLETAFGAKFESDAFFVAGGLRIDGKADGLDTGEWYSHSTRNSVGEDANQGMGAYIGFGLLAIENLTANIEARFNNLGAFSDYGWIWINETVKYAMAPLEFGLVMHQFLFAEKNKFVVVGKTGDESVGPRLTFKPFVNYALTEKWTVGLNIPVGFWMTGIVDYDIAVQPKVSYKLGENASINGWYKFNMLQRGDQDGVLPEKPDSRIYNTVQIDFIWSF
ncbi:MAG: hypothetical protein LBD74_05460 [Spirochaetaceae bacterium]|nr:hypothetical protein [Spirochaetaceae bacterium]